MNGRNVLLASEDGRLEVLLTAAIILDRLVSYSVVVGGRSATHHSSTCSIRCVYWCNLNLEIISPGSRTRDFTVIGRYIYQLRRECVHQAWWSVRRSQKSLAHMSWNDLWWKESAGELRANNFDSDIHKRFYDYTVCKSPIFCIIEPKMSPTVHKTHRCTRCVTLCFVWISCLFEYSSLSKGRVQRNLGKTER